MQGEPVTSESQPIEPTASQMSDEELAILLGSNPEKKGFDVAVEWVRTHREEAEEAGEEKNQDYTGDNMESAIKEKEGAYKGDHAKIMMAIQNLKEMIVNAKMGDDEKTSALTSLDQVQQDVATLYDSVEANGVQPVDLKRIGASEPKIYVHKDGKTIMIPKSKHNEYLAKGWKQSGLRAEASYESKLANMLNQQLK